MPSQHKNPMLGWRPLAERSAWARAEAQRRGVNLKVILDEALDEYYERHRDLSGYEINHKDGDPRNNDPANLEIREAEERQP